MGGIHGEYGDDGEYPCTMKKDAIIADLCESMSCELNCEMRGCFGCGITDVIWHDNMVFDSLKDAQRNIPGDPYSNEVNAVKYYYAKPHETKKLKDLRLKEKELHEKVYSAEHDNYFENHKSKYIACSECGSRINISYIDEVYRVNHCPVCGHDMRPATELKRIEGLKTKEKNITKSIKAEESHQRKSLRNKKLCWYIEADVYTG